MKKNIKKLKTNVITNISEFSKRGNYIPQD